MPVTYDCMQAGSERVKDTKAEKGMLKEASSINKSLFTLGKVAFQTISRGLCRNVIHYRSTHVDHRAEVYSTLGCFRD